MRKLSTLCLIAIVAMAVWMIASSVAMAGIANTKHDFTSTSTATVYRDTGSTATLCNTCHIPHNTAGNGRPLWNHAATTATYSWGEVTTLAGTTLPTTTLNTPSSAVSGGSKACLSCHDGSVAVGSLIQTASWNTTRKITGSAKVTGSGSGNGDMTGNHPIAIPYGNGSTYNGIVSKANTSKYKATPSISRIYGTGTSSGIECGSCHDPHDNTLATEGDFLRANQSTLCVDCHNM